MKENVVSNLRVPSCATIEKVISCPKYGEIAATVNANGNEMTFFRTDFLDFERVAWYCADKFCDTWYHEDVPKNVLESIQKHGGFFLSKHLLSFDKNGKVVSVKGEAVQNVDFETAKDLACSLDVPALKSDLPFGVIYDVLGKWLIETETLTEEEWLDSPTDIAEQMLLLTRDCGGWTLKELLDDIFQMEWTQEMFDGHYVVARAGVPSTDGEGNYPSRMRHGYDTRFKHPYSKVRAFLYF